VTAPAAQDVPTPAAAPGVGLTAVLAAIGLPGTHPAVPHTPLDDVGWRTFTGEVGRERLGPLLARAAASGEWPVSADQLDEALALGRAALALVLELERELVGLHDDLRAARVPMRVLKGPAIAHLDEVDPSCRAFGDIDVLVRPGDLRRAVAVVEARGGRRRFASPSASYDRYVGKGASFHFVRNVEVDLHRTIAPGPYGAAVDLDELFAHHGSMPVGPATVDVLDRPGRFLHACYHAVLGRARPRRSAQRDIALTAPVDRGELEVALARARRWHGEAVVAAAVASVAVDLGWQHPPALGAWAVAHRPTARDRRWLDAYRSGARSSTRLTLLGATAGSGAARVRYVAGLASTWPRAAVSAGRRR